MPSAPPKHAHTWMPPRTVPLHTRQVRINNRTYEFDDVRKGQPDHIWKTRWCLYCGDKHPSDTIAA